MGQDVDGFCAILRAGGHQVSTSSIPVSAPRLLDLAEPTQAEVLRLYRALGGSQAAPMLRPGPWDIWADGVLIELDEQLHFNRYRAMTLESSAYEGLTSFPLRRYRLFCKQREAVCLKHGASQGRWMNQSTENHFGPSGPRGDLSAAGASRWKQRALYDFMKDVGVHPLPMARVAIWDVIPETSGLTIEAATNGALRPELAQELWKLVTERASSPRPVD